MNQTQPIHRPSKYSIATRIFHWLGALLLVATWLAIQSGEDFIDLHKSLGASFLIWTLMRIINRFVSRAPAPVAGPKWRTGLAHLTHFGLYVAMLAMPITGMMMTMYHGRGVSIFGLINIPALVAPNPQIASFLNGVHTGLWFYVLVFLTVAHIVAALYHQFVVKDHLVKRMI